MSKKDAILKFIIDELKKDSKTTERKIATTILRDERTVRRYFKILKDSGIIKLEKEGKNRNWVIIKKHWIFMHNILK